MSPFSRNSAFKPIFIIGLWHLSTKLASFFPSYVFIRSVEPNILLATTFVVVIYIFSPLAGFLADVKYGRLKILKCGTYVMLIAVVVSLVIITLFNVASQANLYFYLLFGTFLVAQVTLTCGNAVYLSTILQFGCDQLRDLPTSDTVLFFYAFYWSDNLGDALIRVINVPGHELDYNGRKREFHYDNLQNTLIEVILFISSILLVIVLHLLRTKQEWISTGESGKKNPYQLVYRIVLFAIQHKKIIRRSAFTYCDNEYPSRLDLGKQRYGGPFTTEQVEDVKVLLNLIKVLLSVGPIFLLDLSSKISVLVHYKSSYEKNGIYSNPAKIMFLDYDLMSLLLAITGIPLYLWLVKPCWLRCCHLSVFKRIGLGLIVLINIFLLFLTYRGISDDRNHKHHIFFDCESNTTDYISYNIVSISGVYLLALYNVLSCLYQALLYIALWEFICSQSPQYMKGILFGLFYAIRALYQLLAIIITLLVFYYWKYTAIDCQSGYNILHFAIGVCTLIIYTIVAWKYQYRKRDDICNVYQYAEDYYSNA